MSVKADEMKKKVKGYANKTKEFVKENKVNLVVWGITGVALTGCIVAGRRHSKVMDALWRNAKEQLDHNDITNFGPYKVCKFFEPDGSFIGQLPMHEQSVEMFLRLK